MAAAAIHVSYNQTIIIALTKSRVKDYLEDAQNLEIQQLHNHRKLTNYFLYRNNWQEESRGELFLTSVT